MTNNDVSLTGQATDHGEVLCLGEALIDVVAREGQETAEHVGGSGRRKLHITDWDGDGRASDYSAPAKFEMGLLVPSDWQGKWIGGGGRQPLKFVPGRHFRR